MKQKINWLKIKKNILCGLVISLIISIILIVSLILKLNVGDSLIAVSVTQLGVASLWLIIRLGLFSTMSFGTRKYIKSNIKHRKNGIGLYKKYKKSYIKSYESPLELEVYSSKKSKIAIYIMYFIGIIELIITIVYIYF